MPASPPCPSPPTPHTTSSEGWDPQGYSKLSSYSACEDSVAIPQACFQPLTPGPSAEATDINLPRSSMKEAYLLILKAVAWQLSF